MVNYSAPQKMQFICVHFGSSFLRAELSSQNTLCYKLPFLKKYCSPFSAAAGTCSVTEKKSGLVKPCQFPFNFKGQTFESCTTIIGTDPIVHGDAWCSTNTDSNDNHIDGGSFYGDCQRENCPSALDLDWVANDETAPERDEDGNYLFGDMILSEQQYEEFYGDGSKVIEDAGIKSERYRWPSGEGVHAGKEYYQSKYRLHIFYLNLG